MAGKFFKSKKSFWRVNENIRAPKLRVIGPEGKQLGVFSFREALDLAQKEGVDLVEIAPTASPPVAKVVDFAKFRYQQEKRERELAKKEKRGAEIKEVWLSPFMADNDYANKLGKVTEFLEGGHKVRLTVKFTRPQMQHKEFGFEVIKRVAADLKGKAQIDQEPRFFGKQLVTTLSPIKAK